MTDIHQIKRLSIRDYLSRRGIRPARENDRCGFYLSPLRKEHTPSFKVDYVLNLWYDFGTDKGGSIIDLVMGLENCDKSQAIRLLDCGEISPASLAPASATPTVPALRILAHTPLQHAALIGYLRERGISPAIAAAYCRQVRYAVGGREFFAIGFRNDAGGWELRSEYFKGGSSPKHITTIDNHADTCIAFEGFMDFLSYLTLKKVEWLRIDAVVLNSVVNVGKAIPFLQRHRAVHTFFDNDEAGRRATAQVQQLAPAVVEVGGGQWAITSFSTTYFNLTNNENTKKYRHFPLCDYQIPLLRRRENHHPATGRSIGQEALGVLPGPSPARKDLRLTAADT